tara:strand:+ start:879 stop:1262 length:384 start_codon:yes stop_codon:yes gene_type:complete
MEYHKWSDKNKTCDCCGLTLREIQKQNDEAREELFQKEKEWNFWVAMLDTFEQDVDDNGIWHGPQCRRCSGAPQTVGEMFLAKFSEGQWLCNKCYARFPEDTRGRWVFMPVEDEETLLNDQKKLSSN